jgi:regulator of nucleoside diphosphate kinase
MNRDITTERPRITPAIMVTAGDYARLSVLVGAATNRMPAIAAGLADELDRADVLPTGHRPKRTVCMGCEVMFRDDTTGKVRNVILVYPEEADISAGRISVLTPIGTALLGLGEGHSIDWETRDGECRSLTVIEVREVGQDTSPADVAARP